MTTGQKIYELRKEANLTQEELAEKLGVTRQAVSRWESDITFPETKQIMELCRLFHISSDELLFGERMTDSAEMPSEQVQFEREEPQEQIADDGKGRTWGVIDHGSRIRFEYISKCRCLGMPLLHINLGFGLCRAHGIFAIGIFAAGLFSMGIFSAGLLSLGVFVVGLLVFGSFVLGGAAFGGIALGVFAVGGIAVGVLSFGGVAIGQVAVGGLAIGQFALGDYSYGWLSVGISHAEGAHPFLVPDGLDALSDFLGENVSEGLAGFIRAIAGVLRN